MHTLVVVGRVVVGLVFVAFGVMKWRAGVSHGARIVRGFDLVPERFVSVVAVLLPPVEILLGVLLLVGVAPPLVAVASCLLLLVFCGAMISALRRGIVTECGCAGTALKSEVSWLLISRNCAFMALLLPSIVGGI